MKELCTEIDIHAPAEQVWQILTDLEHYSDWNPYIYSVTGSLHPGDKVDIRFHSGPKDMTLHCQVIRVEPNREVCWKYHVFLPALFQGEHSMRIEPLGENRVRFIDREVFGGMMVFSQAKSIDTDSKKGFEAMDQALKARAEKQMVTVGG